MRERKATMTEQGGEMARNRRRILRGGTSLLVAAALPANSATAESATVTRASAHSADIGPMSAGNVTDLGAVGDGRTDDTRAFETAYTLAAARVRDGVGRLVVEIPAGDFLITRPYALLNGVAPPPRPANGLRFVGAGKNMTALVFRPDTGPGSYLCR